MSLKTKLARYAVLCLVCYQLMTDSRQTSGVAFVHLNRFVSDGTILHLRRTKAVAGRSRRSLPLQQAHPNCGRCSRDALEPLLSAAEQPETSARKVLDDVLGDPFFLESFRKLRVPLHISDALRCETGGSDKGVPESTDEPLQGGGKLIAASTGGGRRASGYESATMRIVEELQASLRGFVAKVAAAIESAGIYVSNRAQMDTKVIAAVVEYASGQAAAATGNLLLAATGAASPAHLLAGMNATESQQSLKDSAQLLSLGMVADSLDKSPKMLTSLKDFDNDDKRLNAAYRRQRRLRSKPLPARLLGALPSTLNNAADLAHEVEQEVKYERAGSRANKLLKPLGISLPEAPDTSLLLGGLQTSGGNLLEGSPAAGNGSAVGGTVATSSSFQDQVGMVGDAIRRATTPSTGSLRVRAPKRVPTPAAPKPFGSWNIPGQNAHWNNEEDTSHLRVANVFDRLKPDPTLPVFLAAWPQLLRSELSICVGEVEGELATQQRSMRAADAVLCSTETVLISLGESKTRNFHKLEQLRSMAGSVQQEDVLAEMTEAVEAAEAHMVRLEQLESNVEQLYATVRAYIWATAERTARLARISSRVGKARAIMNTAAGGRGSEVEDVAEALEVLQEFDEERARGSRAVEPVNVWLGIVCRESSERALNGPGNVHEDAFSAAARLWEASSVLGAKEDMTSLERLTREFLKVEQPEALNFVSDVRYVGETDDAGRSNVGAKEDPDFSDLNQLARPDKSEIAVSEEESEAAVASGAIPNKADDALFTVYTEGENIGMTTRVKADSIRAQIPGQSRVTTDSVPQPSVTNSDDGVRESGNSGERLDFVVLGDGSTDLKVPYFVEVQRLEVDFPQASHPASDALDMPAVGESRATLRHEQTTSRPVESTRFDSVTSLSSRDRSIGSGSGETSIEVAAAGRHSYVDVEADVKDDASDVSKVVLKILDVTALLVEKILFVGLPTILSNGAVVWERVDNAVNGGKGPYGWRLLKGFKRDWIGENKAEVGL